MTTTTRILAVAALAAGALLSVPAQAEEGHWVARVRALRIDPANKSDAIDALGVPADQIEVSKKWAPDVDFEYFFGGPWSAELLLTVPQKHDVSVKGLGTIGTFKHLPPTLTVKYNFNPNGAFRPYIGVGVNYTLIMDVNLSVPPSVTGMLVDLPLKLDTNSFGLAGQAGFDVKINDHWFASVDAKYVKIKADVKLGAAYDVEGTVLAPAGTKVSNVKVDPWLLGVGVGYRF